jgi:hypothetical protein
VLHTFTSRALLSRLPTALYQQGCKVVCHFSGGRASKLGNVYRRKEVCVVRLAALAALRARATHPCTTRRLAGGFEGGTELQGYRM